VKPLDVKRTASELIEGLSLRWRSDTCRETRRTRRTIKRTTTRDRMFDYRIDRFGNNGRLEGGDGFAAASDEEAKARAEKAARGGAYELWSGRRLVVKVPAEQR
jgi:hypothetical protein